MLKAVFAAAVFTVVACAANAAETALIDERVATTGDTGRRSPEIVYSRITRVASLDGEHFRRIASEAKHRKGDEPAPEPEPESTTIS